jgi:hypothetical protein
MNNAEEIFVDNTEEKFIAALEKVDEFISNQPIKGKQALHLRLLAEEALGMVKAMTGDFKAVFSMEGKDGDYKIKLALKTDMSMDKKTNLLSVSKSGKNAAVKGFMSKIGEIIENGLLNFDDVMKLQQEYVGGYTEFAYMGLGLSGGIPISSEPLMWSLQNYRNALTDAMDDNKPVEDAWDELEKSIVASIAKDVIVGVKRDRVDLIIVA